MDGPTSAGSPAPAPGTEAVTPTFTPSCRYFVALDWLEVTWHGAWFAPEPQTLASNSTIGDERHPTPEKTQRLSFRVPVTTSEGQKQMAVVELLNNPKISGPKSKHYQTGLHVLFIPQGAKRTANQRAEVDSYGAGFLSVNPHEGNNCKPGSAIFQANNHLQYREDLWTVYNAIKTALGAAHGHFTRLDVCIDTRSIIEPYNDYWLDYHSQQLDPDHVRKYAMMGKVKVAEAPLIENGKVSLFHHGSTGSAKSLKGYCKGIRVYEENKLYIVEAWRKAGLIGPNEDGKDIERLEITLRREAIKNLAAIDTETAELSEAFNPAILDETGVLAGIFKATCKGWFDIAVVNPNDKNKSRWERVEIINWDAIATAPVVRLPKTCKPSEIWRAKHSSYKLARDSKAYSYPETAVRRYLQNVPSFTIDNDTVSTFVNRITAAITGRNDGPVITGLLEDFAATIKDGLADHMADWTAKELPCQLAEAMAQYHGVGAYLQRRLRKDIYSDSKDWKKSNNARTAAEGFPFPTSVPATCDASPQGYPDPAKMAEGMGPERDRPQPKNLHLQSNEPGNKKGMLDGPIVSPQTIAQ